MKTIRLITLILLISIIAIGQANAQGQIPLPPVKFNAVVEMTNMGPVINMNWVMNEQGPRPNIFNIYMTMGDQEKLQLVARVKVDPNLIEYKYSMANIKPGVYNLFIRSAIMDNNQIIESEKTPVITLEVKPGQDGNGLRIGSEPP